MNHNLQEHRAPLRVDQPKALLDIMASFLKKTLWPLFMVGVQLRQGYSHFEEAVYFLPFSSQKFLVLILSTSEGWKAESTLEPPSGFEHGTPGLGIQCLNHLAIAPLLGHCLKPFDVSLIGMDGGLSSLCHSCRFACQQRVLENVSWP